MKRPERDTDIKVNTAKEAAKRQAERMVARAGVDSDPIEHLIEALQIAANLAAVWGEMVAALDASAPKGRMRGKLGYHEDVLRGELITVSNEPLLALDKAGAARLHPFVTEYHAALERWARLAKLAVDAGVSERLVAISEQQAQVIAKVVQGALTELGVAEHPDAPAVVRRHLALVSGAGA